MISLSQSLQCLGFSDLIGKMGLLVALASEYRVSIKGNSTLALRPASRAQKVLDEWPLLLVLVVVSSEVSVELLVQTPSSPSSRAHGRMSFWDGLWLVGVM